MKNSTKTLLISLTLLIQFSCTENTSLPIAATLFNDNWKFYRQSENETDSFEASDINDESWENVAIPHTAKLEPLVVNDQWQGTCWYRKHFQLPENIKNKKVFIRFEGAMNKAEVWLNGKKMGTHLGGYLPFTFDLSENINFNEDNILAIKLDNRDNPITGPKPLKILDFNTYGGIYRNVWLEIKDPVYITDPILANKTASGGIFVTYPKVSSEEATIKIQTHVANASANAKKVKVNHQIIDQGQVVLTQISEPVEINSNNDKAFETQLELDNPRLWSPKSPNLYLLNTQVFVDSKMVDQQQTRIGIRHMEFKGKDFYLNGEQLFLRGVNRHQEYPFIGYALSDNAQFRDAEKIKNAGFDYVRLSHYPHSESFMDACDELGLLVIDAILGWQYYNKEEAFQDHVIQTGRDMIRRDRNHPCVLAWEVSLNESWQPEPFIDELTRVAHEEYPGDQCFSAGWQEYGYDIYLQARQHRLNHYNENLEKPYVVSEYGDWEYYAMNAGLNQDSWQNMLPDARSSRQLRSDGESRLLQQALNLQEAHNDNFNTIAFADGYWVMFDYNRGYSDDLEASGIMDIFRIPKYSYYFYRSQRDADENSEQFDAGPMVYIASEWTENSSTDVRIFSNCEEVELKLNGKVIAKQKPDNDRISSNLAHPPFTFKITNFGTGTLEAIGYIQDKEQATYKIQTPEEPVKLQLVLDKSQKEIQAGCKDVFFVYVHLKDKNGTTVPESSGTIALEIEGDATLMNTEPLKFEAGIATALVMAGEQKGVVNLSATAKDLEPGQINIDVH